MHQPCHSDTQNIKYEHRGSENAHAHDIRRGDHSSHDEDDEYGKPPMVDHHLGIDQSEQCQKENKYRHFEDHTQPEYHSHEQAGVFIDCDHRLELLTQCQQELQSMGEYQFIGECSAG